MKNPLMSPAVRDILRDLDEISIPVEPYSAWNTNALCSAIAKTYVDVVVRDRKVWVFITPFGRAVMSAAPVSFFTTRSDYMRVRRNTK